MKKAKQARVQSFTPFGDSPLGSPFQPGHTGLPFGGDFPSFGQQNPFGQGFAPPPSYFAYPFAGMFPGGAGGQAGAGPNAQAPAQQASAQQAPNTPQPVDFWKQIGGLDGIITNLGKVQKVMQLTQSLSPYMKLFIKSIDESPPSERKKRGAARRSSKGKHGGRR